MIQDIKENQVLSAIDTIFRKGHKSKFSETYIHSVEKEAEIVAKYLNIESQHQDCLLWGMLLGMGVQSNSSIDIDTLSQYLNVPVLQAFQLSKSLEFLAKRKLLQKQKGSRRRRGVESLQYLNFFVPGDIVQSVVNGEPLPPRRKMDMDIYQLLDLTLDLFQQRDDGYIDTEELGTEVQEILEENNKLPFVRQVLTFKLPVIEQIILLMVCQQFVQGYPSVDLVRLLKTLFIETQKQLQHRKEWINSRTRLQQLNLVDLESEADFRNDKAIQLTQKGQELFGSDRSLLIEQDTPKPKDIILSTSISEQKLFFNQREQGELDFLSNLLQPSNYDEVVGRLKANNMKLNFTILFSGHPGTGKTESVYQIARSTGRDIKMVDISKTKSKWFGESEKLIMGIFTSYRKLVESSKLTPILLFNEADGIFSSRQTGDESSVSQTQNAMQTLLLQAMEDFEGICICTTNLPMNLKEFERRFLYKISFDKPDSNTRFKILRDKIPFLTDDQIYRISESYSLTGGQIANLSKKFIMNQILKGNYPDMDEILRLCESEFMIKSKGRSKIGFKESLKYFV